MREWLALDDLPMLREDHHLLDAPLAWSSQTWRIQLQRYGVDGVFRQRVLERRSEWSEERRYGILMRGA